MNFVKSQAYQDLFRPAEEGSTPQLTKLVCTLGPATKSVDVLRSLVKAGMRGARIQLKSMSAAEARAAMAAVDAVVAETGVYIATIVDTIGPELRVVQNAQPRDVSFAAGARVTMTRGAGAAMSPQSVPVACETPFSELGLAAGAMLYVSTYLATGEDDLQTLPLQVKAVAADSVECVATGDATLPSHSSMTVHGKGVNDRLPILSQADQTVIASLKGDSMAFLSLGFCRSAADVASARAFLAQKGLTGVKVLAKLCTPQAVASPDPLIAAADGIVLARGTLGLELPAEKVFLAQKQCLRAANLAGKLAAVTQVVDTMVHAPRPTRAEATDVANLVLDGADCILLGDETSHGSDPTNCAKTVSAICRQAEACYDNEGFYTRLMDEYGGFRDANLSKSEALASSAVRASKKLGATLILAFTKTGRTSGLLAKYRAAVPILTVIAKGDGGDAQVASERLARQSSLQRAVIPLLALPSSMGPMAVDGSLTEWALKEADRMKLVAKGDRVVVSQCPRVLADGLFEEAAVVKFIVAGDAPMKNLPPVGSCTDMAAMAAAAQA